MRNRTFCNLEFLFLFTIEGNIQCVIKVLRLAMEHADGDKCKIDGVYFARSNDGICWGKKLKLSLSACQKTLSSYVNLQSFERSRYFFLRHEQNSPITSHARLASCISQTALSLFAYTRMKFLSFLTQRLSFCSTHVVKVQVS